MQSDGTHTEVLPSKVDQKATATSGDTKKKAIVFVGESGIGKTHLVNRLFDKNFPSEASLNHVTESANQFDYKGVTIIDAVGKGNTFFNKYDCVKVVYLSSMGRIDVEKREWIKAHPKLEKNMMLVMNYRWKASEDAKVIEKARNSGWMPYDEFLKSYGNADQLLYDIPEFVGSEKPISTNSSKGAPKEAPKGAPDSKSLKESPKVVSFIMQCVPHYELKDLEQKIIRELSTVEIVKNTKLLGDADLKYSCLSHGLTQMDRAWDNQTIVEFLGEKMPEFLKHIKECIYKNDENDENDEITFETIGNALEAVIGWRGSDSNTKRRLGLALKYQYLEYVKERTAGEK
jgi:GTP-binding protein EngB required for normal cell division